MGGGECPLLTNAENSFLKGDVSIQGGDINGANDGCVGNLVLDVFQLGRKYTIPVLVCGLG